MMLDYLPGEYAEGSALHSMLISSFELRHLSHALKKKIPVSTAFITNIASNACTTEAVVA